MGACYVNQNYRVNPLQYCSKDRRAEVHCALCIIIISWLQSRRTQAFPTCHVLDMIEWVKLVSFWQLVY